ncbi:MAG: hypothetical protein LC624_11345, partial [Halobacteriales archaeon]|nr:hypothetical protein [Halobacteriales archaeon]
MRSSLLPVLLGLLLLLPSAGTLPLGGRGPSLTDLVLARDADALRARFAPPVDGHLAPSIAWGWALRDVPVGSSPPLRGSPGLSDAVVAAESALGLGTAPDAVAAMRAQEQLLDPALAHAAARLVDALVAHGDAQRAWALGDVSTVTPDLRASALQAARAVDAVQDAMRGVRVVPTDGSFLFRDPYDLVLIGDAGPNLYAGNHAPHEVADPDVNLLTLDLGGDDTYTEGAGAAYPFSPCFRYVYDENLHRSRQGGDLPDPSKPRLGFCGNGLPAAASIDLAGNDRYVSRVTLGNDQHHAAQGGAFYGGLGILLDAAGDDVYDAEMVQAPGTYNAYQSVQGAAGAISYAALGFLFDLGGSDTYLAAQQLSDTPLPPLYYAQQRAQGGDDGMLVDLAGDDRFTVEQRGPQQAWQTVQGFVGILVDGGGADRYTLLQETGPGSYQLGTGGDGVLIEVSGSDVYLATQRCPGGCAWQDVQGSAEPLGFGVLYEGGGDDTYTALAGDLVAQRVHGSC